MRLGAVAAVAGALVGGALIGCERGPEPEPKHLPSPVAVRLGACAPTTVAFVAGPRPQSFDPDAADPDAAAPAPMHAGRGSAIADLLAFGHPGVLSDLTGTAAEPGEPGEPQLVEYAPTAGAVVVAPPDTGGGGFGLGGVGTRGFGNVGFGNHRDRRDRDRGSDAGSAAGSDAGWGYIGVAPRPRPDGIRTNPTNEPDRLMIRRFVRRQLDPIEHCFAGFGAHFEIDVDFAVGSDGVVTDATATASDQEIGACIAGIVKKIEFARPQSGAIQVHYPFVFGANPPPTSIAHAHELFAAPRGAGERSPPQPTTPLAAVERELGECFAWDADHPFGDAVIDLGAARAQVHGIASDHVRDCVVAVAAKLHVPAARCPLAWGSATLAALPAIEIDGAAVKLERAPIQVDDGETASPIAALATALATRHAAVLASTAGELTQHEPWLVRATEPTPMKLVWRAINSVLVAGDDFVLARAVPGPTFPPAVFPGVPVPFATGVPWNRIERRVDATQPDDRAQLCVYVTSTDISVDVSGIHDHHAAERGPDQIEHLGRLLHEDKVGALFVERDDLQIGAADDARFGDVIAAIEAAQKAGFVHWRLTDRAHLAAPPK